MSKRSIGNTPGHITEGDVLSDLGFTSETEAKIIEERLKRIDVEAESILARLRGIGGVMAGGGQVSCYHQLLRNRENLQSQLSTLTTPAQSSVGAVQSASVCG